jgi:hypothetical protein
MATVWTVENHTRDSPFRPYNDRLRTGYRLGMEDRAHGCDDGYGGRRSFQLLEAQTKNSPKQPYDGLDQIPESLFQRWLASQC